MKISMNVEHGKLSYSFENVSSTEIQLLKKALMTNWAANNFKDGTEERLCANILKHIDMVWRCE